MIKLHPAFDRSAHELAGLIDPSAPLIPELETARQNRAALRNSPQAEKTLAWSESYLPRLADIPLTSYTAYRAFQRTGDRLAYQAPYFDRRAMLADAALRLFLDGSQSGWKDPLQNLIWAVCEESTWVLPAHEGLLIDLMAAETAFLLGEALNLLGDDLDSEIRTRVRAEVDRRIFTPYLTLYINR